MSFATIAITPSSYHPPTVYHPGVANSLKSKMDHPLYHRGYGLYHTESTRLLLGPGLITWVLGCTFGTILLCVKHWGAQLLGVDFGRRLELCKVWLS